MAIAPCCTDMACDERRVVRELITYNKK